MAEFIPFDKKSLTFGLTWVSISNPKKESRERTMLCRETQADYYVRYAGKNAEQGIKYGLATPIFDHIDKQPNDVFLSAALLFSQYVFSTSPSENSLLLYQIDDKKIAMIALLKGEPYLDIVVKADELNNQLAALRQEDHAEFIVYGNLPAHTTKPISVDDLLSGNTSSARLIRFVDPVKKMWRVGAIFLVIGIAAGITSWKLIMPKNTSETTSEALIDHVQIYKANRDWLLANANFNGEAAFNTIWNKVKNRGIDIAGWSLDLITCQPTQCEELWQRGSGNFTVLSQHIHPPQTITLQPDGKSCLITYPLANHKTGLHYASLPKKDVLWTELLSQQQHLKHAHPDLIFTPGPPKIHGLNPDILLDRISPDELLYSGEITISAPLGLLAEILQHQLKHVMINEIVIDAVDNIHLATTQIKGTYYAQH